MSETKHTPGPEIQELLHDLETIAALLPAGRKVRLVEGFRQLLNSETNLAQLEADSKKLREPATCNAGHKSNLPLALWDCPVCTQLLRDKLQKVEELVQMIASYQERILKNPTDVDSYPTAADIFGKNREVEAALKGQA